MKSMVMLLALLAACLTVGSGEALAQYNLRTVPSTPQAGSPFVVAFDGSSCEVWVSQSPGLPPAVNVQGNTVQVAADLLTIAGCGVDILTSTLSVPALPQGTYRLELMARGVGVPGEGITVQAVSFEVGQASGFVRLTIPATGVWAIVALAMLVLFAVLWSEYRRLALSSNQ